MKKKAYKLENIDVYELSFCDYPVNKKRYLFTKNGKKIEKQNFEELHVQIDTDGSYDKTQIVVNGEVLSNLEGFEFYFSKQSDLGEGPGISCSYSKNKSNQRGFVGIENYRLEKSEVNKMIEKMKDPLKKYFGAEVKSEEVVEFKKSETFEETIEKAFQKI